MKKIIFASVALLLLLAVGGFLYFKYPMGGHNGAAAADSTSSSTSPDSLTSEVPPEPDDVSASGPDGVPKTDPVQDPLPQNEPVQGNPVIGNSIDTTKKNSGAAKTAETGKTYPKPNGLEEYLNQISNPSIPRTVRKGWKKEASAFFVSDNVLVLDKHESLSKRYTVGQILEILLDIPHKTKVLEVLMDQHEKITEMHVQTTLP